MKSQNLSVSVKGVSSQTTRSLEGAQPWVIALKHLICDQYNVCPSPQTLRLCFGAHGCLHSHDKRVAGEPPFEHISDPESIRTNYAKVPRDPPCKVSFKCLYLNAETARHEISFRGCPWEK